VYAVAFFKVMQQQTAG